MNYIAEINAFNDWCEQHYLPMECQFLWYKLIAKNNRLGWCEWMSIDNLELMGILGLKREATVIEIKEKLIEAGIVKFVKGKKGAPNRYKIVSLAALRTNGVVKTEVKTEVKSVADTADINKQNKIKQNEKNETPPNPPKRGSKSGGHKNRNQNLDSTTEPKTQYAEFVSMTNEEYSSLATELGNKTVTINLSKAVQICTAV